MDTLTSTFLSPRDNETLPSWGNLLSEISNPEIILILEISTEEILLSCDKTSLRIPSTLNLIIILSSYGSKWISEALFLIAWLITPLINLIIGVSLLPLKRSSVAEIEPANDWRSNSSDNSSDISLDELSTVKELVKSSLNSSELHWLNTKSFFKNLYSSWYRDGAILFGEIAVNPSAFFETIIWFSFTKS